MDKTEVTTFGIQLSQLAAVFHADLPVAIQHAYWIALEDLPLEAVQYACVEALKTETFMPPPAILRNLGRDWTRLHTKGTPAMSHEEYLQLREAQVSQEEIRQFIEGFWGRDNLKEPIPPYDHGSGGG